MKLTDTTENVNIPNEEDDVATNQAQVTETEVTKFISEAQVVSNGYTSKAMPRGISHKPPDANLSEFLARPVLIQTLYWDVNLATFNGSFDPWTLWMQNAAVRDKLSNYHFMRGSLNLKIQINGTPFYFGRLMMAYEPAFGHTISPSTGPFPAKAHSTMSHILLDPSLNNEGHMVLPFINPKTWINMEEAGEQWLAIIHYDQLATLHGREVTDPGITVQVYAYLEEAELAYPSQDVLPVLVPQSKPNAKKKKQAKGKGAPSKDEYDANPNAGLISRPAAVVADIAGRLTEVPVLGPFAMATQIGATALSRIAGLFGYSRPSVLNVPERFIPLPTSSMAVVDAPDNAVPLHVNSKQETTIDPLVNGETDGSDNLTVLSIARKWSLHDVQDWAQTDVVDSTIHQGFVTPENFLETVGSSTQYTALAFASVPFRFWRGSIDVKIMIVGSRFARGRLMFSFSPGVTLGGNPRTNLNYTRIIDIDQSREYVFNIPYAKEQGFLPTKIGAGITSTGIYSLTVVNPLRGSEVAPVAVLVWVRAGADYEVAGPTDFVIAGKAPLAYQSAPNHGQEDSMECTVDPLWVTETSPEINSVFIGDPVRSFRPLMKRYEMVSSLYTTTPRFGSTTLLDTGLATTALQVPYYPSFTGRTSNNEGSFSEGGAAAYNMSPFRTSLITFLGMAFAGKRGTMRWSISNPFSSGNGEGNAVAASDIVVKRQFGQDPFGSLLNMPFVGWTVGTGSMTNPATYSMTQTTNVGADGLAGQQTFPPSDTCINYEVAPYNTVRFFGRDAAHQSFGEQRDIHPDGFVNVIANFRNVTGASQFLSGQHYELSVATGEDFQLVGWSGVPTMTSTTTPTLFDELINGVDGIV